MNNFTQYKKEMGSMATLNKIILFVFFQFCLSIKTYSQNFDKIRKADTIYVFFKKENFKQMTMPQKKGYGDYFFIFNEYYRNKHILFYHTSLTPEERTEKKYFLKRNKDLVVNYTYLINMYNYEDAKVLFFNKKKII
ncbi:hypothetical protein [Flavobacterium collinsii]|nr:hypothetical protein [Flavobacterium collinsii]